MKRITTGLFILLTSFYALADTVSFESAQKTAKSHFKSATLTPVSLAETVPGKKYSAGSPELYAFNRAEGGWVIVAGDDVAAPVLAYSETGTLDMAAMPQDMIRWIGNVRSNIRTARTNNPVKYKEPAKSFGSGKLLNTPNWGQDSPFNDLCPKDGTNRSASGCVATAMAIVLRYHKYPAKGSGTLSGYTTATQKLKVSGFSIDNHTYDWDLMPFTYTSSSSKASKEAVAQLVYDLGVMVQMDYTYEGSGAYSSDMIPELAEHMGYTGNARYVSHSSYTNDQWVTMIANEIENGRPVLYDGYDTDPTTGGGHQFVCDGYDAKGNLHINWGWNGAGNGYFSASYLGNAKTTGVFSYYDDIVIGLQPATSSESKTAPCIQFYGKSKGIGISTDIVKGQSFSVKADGITNFGDASFSGKMKMCLVDRDDNIKESISSETSISIGVNYIISKTFSCKISSDIRPDDGIMLFYQWNGEWYPVGVSAYDEEGEYSENTIGSLSMNRAGVFDLPMIVTRKDVAAGENLYFNIHPGWQHIRSIVWYYDGTRNTKGYVTAQSGTHTIKAVIGYDNSSYTDTVTEQIVIK